MGDAMRRVMFAAGALLVSASAAFAADDVSEFRTLVPGQSGSVVLVYDVAPSGFVENCTVQRSSGFPLLDDASCKMIVLKARFAPATARVRATKTIRWVDGAARPQPVKAGVGPHPFGDGEGTPDDWAALTPGWGGGHR